MLAYYKREIVELGDILVVIERMYIIVLTMVVMDMNLFIDRQICKNSNALFVNKVNLTCRGP